MFGTLVQLEYYTRIAYNYRAMDGNTSFWVAFYHEQLNRLARERTQTCIFSDLYIGHISRTKKK